MTGRLAATLLFSVGITAALAGCGGSSGADSASSGGPRITDPALVPSATPIQNPVLYHISGDRISTSGGSSATVAAGAGSSAAPSAATANRHRVVSGDTCGSIAARYNVTVEALLRANTRIDPGCTNLAIDDELRIPATVGGSTGGAAPAATPRPGSGREYTVAPGDTCDAIARSYGVPVADIISLNGIDANCTGLQVGQVVRIP
jgi:LysM repeat protein